MFRRSSAAPGIGSNSGTGLDIIYYSQDYDGSGKVELPQPLSYTDYMQLADPVTIIPANYGYAYNWGKANRAIIESLVMAKMNNFGSPSLAPMMAASEPDYFARLEVTDFMRTLGPDTTQCPALPAGANCIYFGAVVVNPRSYPVASPLWANIDFAGAADTPTLVLGHDNRIMHYQNTSGDYVYDLAPIHGMQTLFDGLNTMPLLEAAGTYGIPLYPNMNFIGYQDSSTVNRLGMLSASSVNYWDRVVHAANPGWEWHSGAAYPCGVAQPAGFIPPQSAVGLDFFITANFADGDMFSVDFWEPSWYAAKPGRVHTNRPGTVKLTADTCWLGYKMAGEAWTHIWGDYALSGMLLQ